MLALEKPVWRERTRLTSPEVELWRPQRFDVIQEEPPFLLLTQEDNRRLCSRDEKKDAWERLYMKQIRSFMSMHGMLPGYSLGQITKHLLQRVRLWPSLYQIAGTRTRISLFDKRLIRSEVWAAVTSKVWRDSGRAFFFSSSWRRQKEAVQGDLSFARRRSQKLSFPVWIWLFSFLVFFPNVKRCLEYFNRNKTRSVIY